MPCVHAEQFILVCISTTQMKDRFIYLLVLRSKFLISFPLSLSYLFGQIEERCQKVSTIKKKVSGQARQGGEKQNLARWLSRH